MKDKLDIFIKAVNPGYTIDGVSNVGEMIEISRGGDSDEMILLAGLIIDYTNSSGNRSVLLEIPEHTYLAGESILLRLASSPESELAATTYGKTMAFKAKGLRLVYEEEVIDEVCWDSSEGCEKEFKSKEPTVLVRGEDKTWLHMPVSEYELKYEPESVVVIKPEVEEEKTIPQCRDLAFSEILSYYSESQSEQFIEIHNVGTEEVKLDGCSLKYKNKLHPLEGTVGAKGYFVRYLTDFTVAKDPSKVGVVELVDTDGVTVDVLEYSHGQKKGTSYAFIGYDDGDEMWERTYAITPGFENRYQEYRSCEAGKVINPETGNCVKVEEEVEKVCKEGYYLNEETGRCNKVPAENTGTVYALEPEVYEEKSSFVGVTAVLIVVTAALVYVIYEFRHEIKKKIGGFRFFKRR